MTLTGDLTPGKAGEPTPTVAKDGEPVQDLQPDLGAYGHLVALRSGDLAHLHVHPNGEPGDGELRTAAFPVRTVAAANKPIPRRVDEVFQDRRSVTPMSR